MLNKSFAGLNRKPAKLITLLLFASIIAMVVVATPAAKATVLNPKFTLDPTSGAVGATVTITGTGFSPAEPTTFIVNNQMFSTSITSDADGNVQGSCVVPDLPAGTYQVVAHDTSGMTYATAFVVTGGGSATAAPTATSSSSSSGNGNGNGNSNGNGNGNGNGAPTYTPIGTSSNNPFSPLVIGIIAVIVIAIAIPAVLLLRGQGDKRRMMYERERERERGGMQYGPEQGQGPHGGGGYGQPQGGYAPQPSSYGPPPSSPSGSRYTPYSSRSSSYQSRYGQPSSPASSYRLSSYSSRYSQPSTYRQQPSSYSRPAAPSKTCAHCRRPVRVDQNICPYCNKKT